MTPTRTDSIRTQDRMIRTAERLFADRGIESVSLSEINRAAGQRNKSALHYHFGSRDGLLKAILGRHHADIEAARSKMMDEYGELRAAPLEDLLDIAVRPIASMLDSEDGGPEYLRIMAQLMSTPSHPIHAWLTEEMTPNTVILLDALWANSSRIPRPLWQRRFELTNSMIFFSLSAATHERERCDTTTELRELQISHLVDSVAAVMKAPPSDRTVMWGELVKAGTGAPSSH